MVLQNGMWTYNESGRLMPPTVRLPSHSRYASRVERLDEAVGGRIGRIAGTVNIEPPDELWIEYEIFVT